MNLARQPVHVIYGGAHLFRPDICRRLGEIALRALQDFAPDSSAFQTVFGMSEPLAEGVHARVIEKLGREPVEDYRIDFEDGYGYRSDAEEDATAHSAAKQMARARDEGLLPASIGIRVKPLNRATRVRSLRTMEIFLEALGALPGNLTVTLPKVEEPCEVATIAEFALPRIEIMVETPASLFRLAELVEAGRGRVTGAHFGAYDYTASLGISAAQQSLVHPACDFARSMMQARLAGTGLAISDGATNVLPVPVHRGESLSDAQRTENRAAIHAAWKLHFGHVRRSLDNGFYQSWDLHPAQLVSRYAAVYSFFLEGLDAASARLGNFIAQAARATEVRGIFDDAATGQGLLNYFARATDCGAITEREARERTGITADELRSRSFAKILDARRKQE